MRAALAEVFRSAGKAHVVGITGVPGSGKSTLVSKLVPAMRVENTTIAVLAIDPSSAASGGAVLGDRVRMSELAPHPGVFIRSMASRGALGGLAGAALGAVDALDACGFETVLIETVGAGQDEIDIASASHTTLVVSPPGLGDDIQAMKAGILEVADIHVVSKCDCPGAERTLAELIAFAARPARSPGEWQPPVIATSAVTGEGIDQLMQAVHEHRTFLERSGFGPLRERRIAEYRALKSAEALLRSRFGPQRSPRLAELVERIARRQLDPYTAAAELLDSAPASGTDGHAAAKPR